MPEKDPHPTHDLILSMQRGDRQAADELMRLHLPGLRAFVRLRAHPALRVRESEEDLVQSVCREVLQDIGNYEYQGEGSFRNWLFTLALHKIRNKLDYHLAEKRNLGRDRQEDEEERLSRLWDCYSRFESPTQAVVLRERIAQVERAFDRLPEHYREIILKARIIGLSHEEIAREKKSTVEASRALLRRAILRLASILG